MSELLDEYSCYEIQQESIRREIAMQPMISDEKKPDVLLSAYADATLKGFIPGIQYLNNKYKSFRKVRGDGNCFYRSFLFAYLETLLILNDSNDEIQKQKVQIERLRFINVIKNSTNDLVELGYSEMTFESFSEMLIELVEGLFELSREQLLETFQEDGDSDYYTWFMRLLTSCKMKQESERFLPFLDGNEDIHSYCSKEVEPMNKECEEVQIIALTEYLGIRIVIEYLDGRDLINSCLSVVKHPDGAIETGDIDEICLLYRPGHYDILYL